MSFPLLVSMDLEPFYPARAGRNFRHTPVPELVDGFLRLLREANCHATFFVVGELARKFPDLIARIVDERHEVGCHGDRHITLDRLGPDEFRRDLEANREALEAAGATGVVGFRAPIFSLTAASAWAYPALRELGFAYSSSVLPAASPLFGWAGFGAEPRLLDGILEIPITVDRIGPLKAPLYGGTYLRVLPWWLVRRRLRKRQLTTPVLSYVHPYDFDAAQPWTMHAGVHGNPFLNTLLFIGRRRFGARVKGLLNEARTTTAYGAFNSAFPR